MFTIKPIFYGIIASVALLGVYFAVLSLVSGWGFAQSQFASFWYFIVSLAIGFGIQIGLYSYLRGLIKNGDRGEAMHHAVRGEAMHHAVRGEAMHHAVRGEGKVLGVTGTTSTAAMISCCTHYLANLLPVLGAVGVVTFVAQYQAELFWVGLLFNLGGIFYIARRVLTLTRS